MVLEVAVFDVTSGATADFVGAYAEARALVAQTPGCRSMRMTRGVETPTRFVLLVEWESVADHESFRSSERFGQWRALLGPHFATAPQVEHFTDA